VARRHEAISEEIAELDVQLDRLVAEVAPEVLSLPAVGTDHAATLLIVAGDNPERLRSEASFASLFGASPVEASCGKVVRHRLNRGGNRDANRALHMICMVRMGMDRRTREYAREVYRVLVVGAEASASTVCPGTSSERISVMS
jgi:transposase